jgi:hypothetical protein
MTNHAGKTHMKKGDKKIVRSFLAQPGVMYVGANRLNHCAFTDNDVADRLNHMYRGTGLLSRELTGPMVGRVRVDKYGPSQASHKPTPPAPVREQILVPEPQVQEQMVLVDPAPTPPISDAVGSFWARLDEITATQHAQEAKITQATAQITQIGAAVHKLLLLAGGMKPAETDSPPSWSNGPQK